MSSSASFNPEPTATVMVIYFPLESQLDTLRPDSQSACGW